MSLLSPLLLASALATTPVGDGDCGRALCNAAAMRPVASVLAQSRSRHVHILQIGDSHTAGDMITDGWRGQLNAAYTSGGRGVVAGGRPYQGYMTWGINALWSPGWAVNGIFGRVWQEQGPAVGMSGYTKTARAAGETLSLTAEGLDYLFDRFTICGIAGPDAGTLAVTFGGTTQELYFTAPTTGPLCREYQSQFAVGYVAVTTRDERPVSVTSMATFRSTGGVTLSNLGVPGSQLKHFNRTSDAQVQAELRAYRPDMIVLAFGTNEGFAADLDMAAYEAGLRAQVRRLRRLAGSEVPMLLIGPPNAMTRDNGIAYAGGFAPTVCETGLMVPGHIAAVRSVQRSVAADMGLAYWDWARAMGNDCAVYQWRSDGFVVRDAVHFNRQGGMRVGRLLAEDFATGIRSAGNGPSAR
jgi:lysophospholipase L1-like esterase